MRVGKGNKGVKLNRKVSNKGKVPLSYKICLLQKITHRQT
jgi:hypothetical protein